MEYRRCEVCQFEKLKKFVVQGTCTRCRKTPFAPIEQEVALKAERWAASHRCRRCKAGLTPDRYFVCQDCLPTDVRETEDLFDSFTDQDVTYHDLFKEQTAKRRLTAKPKACSQCKVVKKPEEFHLHRGFSDGYYNICKVCKNERNRINDAKRRVRMLAERAAKESA